MVSLLQQKAIQGTHLPKMDHTAKYEPFATAVFFSLWNDWIGGLWRGI